MCVCVGGANVVSHPEYMGKYKKKLDNQYELILECYILEGFLWNFLIRLLQI